MGYHSVQRHVALGNDTSNLTGAISWVGDFNQLTVSVHSSTGSASRYTIVGSNQDGFREALGTASQLVNNAAWSLVTVLTGQGIYSITPGFRWINGFRDNISVSAASNVTMIFNGAVV